MRKAKKSLGQNFLKDNNISKKIINLIKIKNKEIIEVGPGYGSLTNLILKNSPKKLYLIEKDNEIFKYLKKKYGLNNNVIILNKDILDYDLKKFKDVNIISNLPYNITSKLLIKFFKNHRMINEVILMIQKEVAVKYDYKIKKLNKYKFLTKLHSKYQRCFDVSRNVFFPKPKVMSTVVKFNFNDNYIDWIKLEKFINNMFKNKRKKIGNNILIKNKKFDKYSDKRIEEIEIDELISIYNSL